MTAVALTAEHEETEWQFEAGSTRSLRRWLRTQPGAPRLWIGTESVKTIVDTYCETPDWRFHRAGFALRIRRTNGRIEATMKALTPTEAGVLRRREITAPLDVVKPRAVVDLGGSLGERVRAIAGRQPIRALVEVRTRRHVFPIRLDGGPVGELSLDASTVSRGPQRAPARIRRVEVEADAASLSEVTPFVDALRAAQALRPTTSSKYEAALEARGLEAAPRPDFGRTKITASLTIGELAFAALRRELVNVLTHEPGTRLGEDVEALHDMRVATRKLRTALKVFADYLPATARKLRRELDWLGAALGQVRDLDVQLARIQAWRRAADQIDRFALQTLGGQMRPRRALARRRLLRVLDSPRYARLIAGLGAMVRRGPSRRSAASMTPALAASQKVIRRAYHKARKVGDEITPRRRRARTTRCASGVNDCATSCDGTWTCTASPSARWRAPSPTSSIFSDVTRTPRCRSRASERCAARTVRRFLRLRSSSRAR
jgi:inorganic triphosphatase YgiF